MSKHSKNKFKKLPEAIGKGLNEIHAEKAVAARKSLVGVLVCPTRKEQFKMACEVLDVKQTDVLNLAIDQAIKKAVK